MNKLFSKNYYAQIFFKYSWMYYQNYKEWTKLSKKNVKKTFASAMLSELMIKNENYASLL